MSFCVDIPSHQPRPPRPIHPSHLFQSKRSLLVRNSIHLCSGSRESCWLVSSFCVTLSLAFAKLFFHLPEPQVLIRHRVRGGATVNGTQQNLSIPNQKSSENTRSAVIACTSRHPSVETVNVETDSGNFVLRFPIITDFASLQN